MSKNNRIIWVDLAKGIAIILVIVGHTADMQAIRGPIFSIHMPVFFILSAFTSRYTQSKCDLVKNEAKIIAHFMPLYLVLFLGRYILLACFRGQADGCITVFKSAALASVMGSGVKGSICGIDYSAVGMVWFFPVLMFGRVIYDILHFYLSNQKIRGEVCTVLGLTGMLISNFVCLPLSFDITLAIQPLFFLGDMLRYVQLEKNTWKKIIISFVGWILLFVVCLIDKDRYLELAARCYPLLLLSLICAACGCMFLFVVCYCVSQSNIVPLLQSGLRFLGRNSIVLFGVHYFDLFWKPLYTVESDFLQVVLRIVIDVLFSITIIGVLNQLQKRIEEK